LDKSLLAVAKTSYQQPCHHLHCIIAKFHHHQFLGYVPRGEHRHSAQTRQFSDARSDVEHQLTFSFRCHTIYSLSSEYFRSHCILLFLAHHGLGFGARTDGQEVALGVPQLLLREAGMYTKFRAACAYNDYRLGAWIWIWSICVRLDELGDLFLLNPCVTHGLKRGDYLACGLKCRHSESVSCPVRTTLAYSFIPHLR
jgi:hypothetical protein